VPEFEIFPQDLNRFAWSVSLEEAAPGTFQAHHISDAWAKFFGKHSKKEVSACLLQDDR
jgi:hypothetical protein